MQQNYQEFKVSFLDLFKRLPWSNAFAIYTAYYFNQQIPKQKIPVYIFLKRNKPEVTISDDFITSLYVCNMQVKSDLCPGNIMNRFYKIKHKIICRLLDEGKVNRVVESEKCYNFIGDNFSFHQLKNQFPKGVRNIDVTEREVYDEERTKVLPYNEEEFKKHYVNLIYYLYGQEEKNKVRAISI